MKPVDQTFKDRADPAAFWEAWVGAVLARAGLYTLHYPFTYDDGKDHSLTFDLMVSNVISSDSPRSDLAAVYFSGRPLEIKGTSLTFHNTDSYPFEEVLVCSQNNFMKKWPGRDYTMRDFLFVSTKTGSIVWLPAMSQVRFGKEVLDKSRNQLYKAVVADRSQLKELSDFVESFAE